MTTIQSFFTLLDQISLRKKSFILIRRLGMSASILRLGKQVE